MSEGPKSLIPDSNLAELQNLCAQTPLGGAIVEVGVYKGGSAWALNEVAVNRQLHLFDTFTGIPFKDEVDIFQVGHFSDTNAEAVQALLPHAKVYAGVFPDTLPADLKEISFVHVDCDQYKSALDCIHELWPRMLPGAIMAFDDSRFDGIRRAINECKDMLPGTAYMTDHQILFLRKELT